MFELLGIQTAGYVKTSECQEKKGQQLGKSLGKAKNVKKSLENRGCSYPLFGNDGGTASDVPRKSTLETAINPIIARIYVKFPAKKCAH